MQRALAPLPYRLAVLLSYRPIVVLRRQLPVYSPLTWGAVWAGLAAAVRGDRDGALRERVVALLKERYAARDILLTDSGTSALRLAIEGAIRDADKPVALPGYGCYDLATAAEGAGATVALYDLDPATLGPDIESLKSLASNGLAAVVVAHLYGYPVDVAAVQQCVGDALLIEDAAQGVGGELRGRLLGSLGSVSVLSFGRGKGMTGGGGGALVANDDRGVEILRRAAELPSYRRTVRPSDAQRAGRGVLEVAKLAVQHLLGRPSVYGIPAALPFLHLGETVYRRPWTPVPMPVACLAVLERVIAEVDRETPIRVDNAGRLARAVERSQRVRAVEPVAGAEPGYLRLPVVTRSFGDRPTAQPPDRRGAGWRGDPRLGILPGYPRPLAQLPSLAPYLVDGPALPGSARLATQLLTVPTHSRLSEGDVEAIGRRLVGRLSG